ncbi:MAG: PDZ domain-containing protein [Verrucomicrobiales bacterium]
MRLIAHCLAGLLAALILAPAALLANEVPSPDRSILRVNVTNQPYNFALPWQKRPPGSKQGLGALLDGRRVLVTAELIQDTTYLEFEVASSGRKLTARVATVDYEANLALLEPKEDPGNFFDGLVPFPLSSKPPKNGDRFEVWQFESNGSPVTSGITFETSRLGRYFIEGSYFLQFDANGAVNYREGSFTLPVIQDGHLAGMLLSYDSDDQVATILPFPIIRAFLDDAADGAYAGFPSFGVKFSPTLDEQLRTYLKLPEGSGGVMITGVIPETSAAAAGLKEGDVLLEIGGHKLDARGNYQDPTWGLLAMGHLVKGAHTVGTELPMKVSRDGELLDLTLKLTRRAPKDFLIEPYVFDRGPRYLILGGLVFSELTRTYLEAFGGEWRDRAPFEFVYAVENPEKFQRDGREKLVFLAGALPSQSTLGYEGVRGAFIEKVNGQVINEIKDLAAALQNPVDGIHKIEIDEVPYTLYVDAALAADDNQNLLPQRYRITQLQRLE